MRRIIILKLTRMGDILESAPLISAIRSVEPDARITLVVNEAFRETAELIADVDQLLAFPFLQFAREMREGDADLVELYQHLEGFADALGREPYDLALNVTNSRLSGVLMGFIRARRRSGLWYDEDGARQVLGGFVRYFAPNEGMRRYNPFNITDFMIGQYGHPGLPCSGRLRIPPASISEADLLLSEGQEMLIGIQTGASEAGKRWRIDDFAAVASRLLEKPGRSIILLGSPDERPLAERLMQKLGDRAARAIDLVGRTSISTLAAVTGRLRLLISNDTGTMHLAAALGVRVLNLSLGSAYFRETGPYGDGHLILEPRIDCRPCDYAFECPHCDCKRRIAPATVTALSEVLLRDGEGLHLAGIEAAGLHLAGLEAAGLEAALSGSSGCDVYRTTFDEDGILEYARLTPGPLRADEVLMHAYRTAIVQIERGGPFEERCQRSIARLQRDGDLHPGERGRLEQARALLEQLEADAALGGAWVDEALEALEAGNHPRIDAVLAAIGQLDVRIQQLGRAQVDIRFLVRGFVLEKEAVRGPRLDGLLRGHRTTYRRLEQCVKWSRSVLERAGGISEGVPGVGFLMREDPLREEALQKDARQWT